MSSLSEEGSNQNSVCNDGDNNSDNSGGGNGQKVDKAKLMLEWFPKAEINRFFFECPLTDKNFDLCHIVDAIRTNNFRTLSTDAVNVIDFVRDFPRIQFNVILDKFVDLVKRNKFENSQQLMEVLTDSCNAKQLNILTAFLISVHDPQLTQSIRKIKSRSFTEKKR